LERSRAACSRADQFRSHTGAARRRWHPGSVPRLAAAKPHLDHELGALSSGQLGQVMSCLYQAVLRAESANDRRAVAVGMLIVRAQLRQREFD
jgi:hypothetical protein